MSGPPSPSSSCWLDLISWKWTKLCVCDRRHCWNGGGAGGAVVRKDGASQHLGKIPLGWEGEAFPRSTGLSWPALLLTSFQLPACELWDETFWCQGFHRSPETMEETQGVEPRRLSVTLAFLLGSSLSEEVLRPAEDSAALSFHLKWWRDNCSLTPRTVLWLQGESNPSPNSFVKNIWSPSFLGFVFCP